MSEKITTDLWKPRSVADTLQLYADWAANYDADVTSWGYATPQRIAAALADQLSDISTPILDFGCGTGFSGQALKDAGFVKFDGTDISAEMIACAETRGIYRKLWQSAPGETSWQANDYKAITAMGVISSGAAPASTLRDVIAAVNPGCLIALSYNDATLKDASYTDAMSEVVQEGLVRMKFEDYGPHLPKKDMNSTVYIIEKT